MNTERGRSRKPANGGFTLIEVVIAMVILAVGLLGLEALGIAASKMAARAAVQSEYTSRAGTRMEEIVGRIRADDPTMNSPYAPSQTPVLSPSGRTVAYLRQSATKNGAYTWNVRVSVRPIAGHPVLATRDSIFLTASVYDPD